MAQAFRGDVRLSDYMEAADHFLLEQLAITLHQQHDPRYPWSGLTEERRNEFRTDALKLILEQTRFLETHLIED